MALAPLAVMVHLSGLVRVEGSSDTLTAVCSRRQLSDITYCNIQREDTALTALRACMKWG